MPLSKKKSNLCKHNAIYFQLLVYFWIALLFITLPILLIDGYQLQLLSSLDIYIDTLKYGKE